MNMILDNYDGKIIPVYECRVNFLTFVLELRKDHNRGSNLGPLGDRSDVIPDQNGGFILKLI